jgi:hypothetical protein
VDDDDVLGQEIGLRISISVSEQKSGTRQRQPGSSYTAIGRQEEPPALTSSPRSDKSVIQLVVSAPLKVSNRPTRANNGELQVGRILSHVIVVLLAKQNQLGACSCFLVLLLGRELFFFWQRFKGKK